MEIVLVRRVVDPTATVLWEKYGNETVNLFEDLTHLTIHHVKSGNHMSTVRVVMRIVDPVSGFLFLFATLVLNTSRMESRIHLRAWSLLRRVGIPIST